MSLDGRLMAVPVEVVENGRAVTPGLPTPLFAVGRPIYGGGRALPWYSVTQKGRFLVTHVAPTPIAVPITVLLNWRSTHDTSR